MTNSTEQLVTHARTPDGHKPEPVSDAALRHRYELLKWGPTAADSTPARPLLARPAAAKVFRRSPCPSFAEACRLA